MSIQKLKNGKREYFKSGAGFTLLLASLIASILLSVGIGIFNIVFKEFLLTSTARESHAAFYSADAGVECALYWDLVARVFATSSDSVPTPPITTVCNGQDITASSEWNLSGLSPTRAVTTFSITFPPKENCVTVIVIKDSGNTTLESRGYNTCNTSNPRRVERGVRVSY